MVGCSSRHFSRTDVSGSTHNVDHAEANRVDASCPFITWQMGLSMVAAGNDPGLAVRALQRAVGPRGLGMWKDNPARAWVEAFPEARSYVRRLATRHPYICPLFGGDLNILLRQGQLALASCGAWCT